MNASDFSTIELEIVRCLYVAFSMDTDEGKRTEAECGWSDVYDILYGGVRFEDVMPHLVEVGAVEVFESEASLLGKLYRISPAALALGKTLNDDKWTAAITSAHGWENIDELPF